MKTGRPRLVASEKKGKITGVRLNTTERKLIEQAAHAQSKSLSEWARETLLSNAKTVIGAQ